MENKQTVLVINGPNLNLLGTREPGLYGALTLEEINRRVVLETERLGGRAEFFQSNHEGALVDRLQAAKGRVTGVVLNAGAYTHTSAALADAISATGLRVIEVHISNVYRREEFRRRSFLSPVCEGVIAGLGWRAYTLAVQALLTGDDGVS